MERAGPEGVKAGVPKPQVAMGPAVGSAPPTRNQPLRTFDVGAENGAGLGEGLATAGIGPGQFVERGIEEELTLKESGEVRAEGGPGTPDRVLLALGREREREDELVAELFRHEGGVFLAA